MKRICGTFLVLIYLVALTADGIAPFPYEQQFRESPGVEPSRAFPLGTDALGRDRLSRLIHGTRVSLVMAPAAALLAVLGAALAGGLAALAGGRVERWIVQTADLTLSLPWILLLVTVRALLPLNVPAAFSVILTFALLGLLGWAGPARVVRTGVHAILTSDYVRAARARGVGPGRLLLCHVLPNARPVLAAQFWTTVPVFILAEANLGLLGLGVTEPLPSWGTLLRELETQAAAFSNPFAAWWMLVPIVLLVLVALAFQGVAPAEARR